MYPRTGSMESRALLEIKPQSNTKHTHRPQSPLIFPDVLSLTAHEMNEIDYLLKKDVQTINVTSK